MTTGFTGTCFHNVSTSGLNHIRTDSKNYSNGFTVIDYNESIKCYYFTYNHEHECFVYNTHIVPTGFKTYNKPVVESDDIKSLISIAINNIREDHTDEMDKHFIQGKNKSKNVTVKNAFVFPPIDDGKSNYYDEEQTQTTLQDILKSPDNFLFLGQQEVGKKSLLFRIITEYLDEYEVYNKIPVFIDFKEVKNKDFITIIKEYTRLSTENVKRVLENGSIILFIDNLSYNEARNFNNQIVRLHRFNIEYIKVRIIATYEYDGIDILPREIINHCKILFSYHYIRGLKTKEVKQIMKQWLPETDSLESEEKLEKLVNTFTSYQLPNNALSVHLYLWSVENSDRPPINQAVLMEIYIELILEKLSEQNIYRSSFDFKNKIHLISIIAEQIVRKENNSFCLTYKEFVGIIDDYINNKVGFSFDTNVISDYLFERKIFVKNSNNEIRFAHICFMHFFTAKRMEANPTFKYFILDESRYFNYPKEIDYYTGLVRNDEETFQLIYNRFKEVFEPLDFILERVNPDEYFNDFPKKKMAKSEPEPIVRNIEIAKIKDNRPTETEKELIYDEQLEKISKQRTEYKGEVSIDFDRMLLIMCNTLRNLEGIENLELKKQAYNDIVKHNITYSILYTQLLIRYIIENKKLPPSIPQNISLEFLLKNMPYNMQFSLNQHLGTKKLEKVITNKINNDNLKNTSEIEKYLSVLLYSDINGGNFEVYLRKFIKSVKSTVVQDYLLFKLTEYLYRRSKPNGKNEELYLDLISDLKIRSQKLPKRLKESIIKDLKASKDKVSRFIGLN